MTACQPAAPSTWEPVQHIHTRMRDSMMGAAAHGAGCVVGTLLCLLQDSMQDSRQDECMEARIAMALTDIASCT